MTAVPTIEVVETDAGTTLHYGADFTMNGAAKLAEPLIPFALKKLGDDAEKQIRQSLENL